SVLPQWAYQAPYDHAFHTFIGVGGGWTVLTNKTPQGVLGGLAHGLSGRSGGRAARASLADCGDTAGVEDRHGDHLVKHPALPERLDVVVLFHVQGVEDREHAQEVGIRQDIHGAMW